MWRCVHASGGGGGGHSTPADVSNISPLRASSSDGGRVEAVFIVETWGKTRGDHSVHKLGAFLITEVCFVQVLTQTS